MAKREVIRVTVKHSAVSPPPPDNVKPETSGLLQIYYPPGTSTRDVKSMLWDLYWEAFAKIGEYDDGELVCDYK